MKFVYFASCPTCMQTDFDMRQFQSDAMDSHGHIARVGPQISQNQQSTNKRQIKHVTKNLRKTNIYGLAPELFLKELPIIQLCKKLALRANQHIYRSKGLHKWIWQIFERRLPIFLCSAKLIYTARTKWSNKYRTWVHVLLQAFPLRPRVAITQEPFTTVISPIYILRALTVAFIFWVWKIE